MIGVKINGRLGNQMFQYAFAYAQARKYFTLFFLDKPPPSKKKYQLNNYFKLRRGEKYLMRIARTLYWRWFMKRASHKVIFQGGEDEIKAIQLQSKSNTFWEGFFQSESYFLPCEERLKQLFTIKQKYKNKFLAKYGDVFSQNEVIVLHIRRTDYLFHGSEKLGSQDLSLPMSYYENCLSKIKNLDNHYIIVLSDDVEFTKSYFSDRPNFHIENNEEIIDFQILQNANKLIISNSTFAWWAAYLNKKKAKVFAPKYWLGFHVKKEYPKGIMMNKFNWVNIK